MTVNLRSALLAATLVLAVGPTALAGQQPSPFDAARILLQQQGQVDAETVTDIFAAGVTANMQIPPEYIGVAFYDERTGEPLDPQEIRALMGAVRQDGARELIEFALALAPGGLPLPPEQLEPLIDAAFIASMRNPPDHISIEYYDVRCGPTGEGGGPSGRTPSRVHQPEAPPLAESPASDDPTDSGEAALHWLRGMAAGAAAEPAPWSMPDGGVPNDIEDMRAIAQSLELSGQPRSGHVLLPVIFWGESDEERQEVLVDSFRELADMGLSVAEASPAADLRRVDYAGTPVFYALMYVRGAEDVMREVQSLFPALNEGAMR